MKNFFVFVYKVIRALILPNRRFIALGHRGFYNAMPDEEYLRRMYRCQMGRELDLSNPVRFTEKLQWLKLYDRRPEYTLMADKYEAKKIIAERAGERYVIPTLGVWDTFSEIDFDTLPDKFVLKCNHDSGSVIVVQDKAKFRKRSAEKILSRGLRRNYYWPSREWGYKGIKPRIIAEQYLETLEGRSLTEYKIFCFDGQPGLILVCKGKAHSGGRTNDFYDLDFNHIPVTGYYPNSQTRDTKPAQYDEMLEVARKLSTGIPQVRIDLYLADGRIYVGEFTFSHEGGFTNFKPEIYDEKFGAMIHLPERRP